MINGVFQIYLFFFGLSSLSAERLQRKILAVETSLWLKRKQVDKSNAHNWHMQNLAAISLIFWVILKAFLKMRVSMGLASYCKTAKKLAVKFSTFLPLVEKN